MTPRAAPLSADDRRAAIVAATVPLLAVHGGGVTTKQIAEAAGIAEGTIFRVFPDKRALLLAVAEATLIPAHGREDMAEHLRALPDLRSKVVAAVEMLVARMEQSMQVMMALRAVLLAQGEHKAPADTPPGPPAFVHEANQILLENLRDLLFAPHADELRVEPERAALVLRSLVLGAWHPGMPHGDGALTPEEVADLVLEGLLRREA